MVLTPFLCADRSRADSTPLHVSSGLLPIRIFKHALRGSLYDAPKKSGGLPLEFLAVYVFLARLSRPNFRKRNPRAARRLGRAARLALGLVGPGQAGMAGRFGKRGLASTAQAPGRPAKCAPRAPWRGAGARSIRPTPPSCTGIRAGRMAKKFFQPCPEGINLHPVIPAKAGIHDYRKPRILRQPPPPPIGVGEARCLPSLRTVRAVLPHTALQSVGSS